MNEFDRRDEHGDCNICLGDVLKKWKFISLYTDDFGKKYIKKADTIIFVSIVEPEKVYILHMYNNTCNCSF